MLQDMPISVPLLSGAQPRAWITLAAVSAVYFLITATTFTSLGVVLPSMIGELHWSWSAAGLGFTLLGVVCGLTSTVPAWLIRHAGLRPTLVLGSAVMAAAFLCLARTRSVALYDIACCLAGLGFTLLATVPGTYLLARCFVRPSFAFGLYFTVGGLGGVAGPLGFLRILSVSGDWRDYWLMSAALTAGAGILAAVLVDTVTDVRADASVAATQLQSRTWSAAAALRTPQFAVLAAAYGTFLLVGITVNAISVGHLAQRGVPAVLAGGLLSGEAFINAVARIAGGALGDVVDPRKLLALSLAALIAGLVALAFAHSLPLLLLYAACIGIGYGLTFFASTILLLNYFGAAANLELFSMVNLTATLASVGPLLAGWTHDLTGGFVPFLLALAGFVALVLVAVLAMRPPARPA
jgi:MFS family permease